MESNADATLPQQRLIPGHHDPRRVHVITVHAPHATNAGFTTTDERERGPWAPIARAFELADARRRVYTMCLDSMPGAQRGSFERLLT
jgi:hypothetical protein